MFDYAIFRLFSRVYIGIAEGKLFAMAHCM